MGAITSALERRRAAAKRRRAGWFAIVTSLLFCVRAFAEGPAKPGPAIAVWALESELTVGERRLLFAAATLSNVEAERCTSVGGGCNLALVVGPRRDWRADLITAVRKVAAAGGWKAALLPTLGPVGSLLETRPAWLADFAKELAAAAKEPAARTPEAKTPAAGGARAKGACDFLKQRERSRLPFDDAMEKCVNSLPGVQSGVFKKEELKEYFFLVVDNPSGPVRLVTDGKRPEVFSVDGAHVLPGGRLFTLVRANTRAVVRVESPSHLDVPLIGEVSVRDGEYYDASSSVPRCLAVDLPLAPTGGQHVFVNGVIVGSSDAVVDVPEPRTGAIDVSVVQAGAGGTDPIVLSSVEVTRAAFAGGGCHHVKLDLTPPDRERGGVAVVSVLASEPCRARGFDDAEVRRRAEAMLERIGQRVKSAQRWAATARQLGDLLRDLNQGQAVGAPRGRFDSQELTATGAAEFARQGFGSLLAVELGCYGQKSGEKERYSVQVHRLDLSKLAGPRDALTGLDLSQALRKESEAVSGDGQLDRAFVAAFSKLFDAPYAAFEQTEGPRAFKSSVYERVSVYVPTPDADSGPKRSREPIVRGARLEAYALSALEAYVCEGGDEQLQRGGYRGARHFWARRDRGSVAERQATLNLTSEIETANSIEWYPHRPGTYLLRFELSGGRPRASGGSGRPPRARGGAAAEGEAADAVEGRAVAYACVKVANHPRLAFADLGYLRGLSWTPAPDARDSSLSYGRFVAGLLFRPGEASFLSVGFAAGYANAVHSLAAPTAWELSPDAAGTPAEYDISGRASVSWTRQSILLGPALSLQVSAIPCLLARQSCSPFWRGFDLVARMTPVFDVGRIFPGGSTSGLPRFFSNTGGLDLDLSLLADVGVRWRVGERSSLFASFSGALLGWDDFVLGGRVQTNEQGSVTYDARVTAGGAFGATWGF